ncbi:MAG: helix-turn-helix domain-containing protein [bacterium]|nr:helix-turn-helix domain-containing protein [bacterium]
MTRVKDKQRALALRKEGKSYSQIKKELGVSKSTLSYWLCGLPLSKERVRALRDWNEVRIERYRETMFRKKELRLQVVYESQKDEIFPFSKRDLYIAGLFLYWGEGSKTRVSELEVANTDPAVPKFFIYWTTHCLNLEKEKIRVHLHLYSDMNIESEIAYWSHALKLPREQFTKPYIKKNSSQSINRGTFGHGTCTIKISNARVAEKILQGLKAVREKFGP